MGEALIAAKRPFEQMLYPGRGHGIEGSNDHLDAYRRIVEHFRRNLGRPK
jgi:dipeptidyl aminopeptidase/acylaminoacyl peptidase